MNDAIDLLLKIEKLFKRSHVLLWSIENPRERRSQGKSISHDLPEVSCACVEIPLKKKTH